MQTLAYGYLLPEDTDTGDDIFDALEFDIQQLATHNHDGSNSAPLGSQNQDILAGGWIAAPIGGGLYMQTVAMPGTLEYDVVDIWFKLSTGEFVYPSIEKVSSNSYKIYTNDNTLDYVAYYR